MIVGTHNSSAYKLDLSKNFWSYSNIYNVLRKMAIIPSMKRRINQLTLTQDLTISQQLAIGCSMLDIRVSYLDGIFYVNHTFCCGTLEDVLDQIVESVPIQLVVLIKPDWQTRHTMVGKDEQLCKFLTDKLGKYLGDTIECYSSIVHNDYANIQHIKYFNIVWLNVSTADDFQQKLKHELSVMNPQNTIIYFTLTMKDNPSINDMLKTDLRKYAQSIVKYINLIEETPPFAVLFDFISTEIVDRLIDIK